MTPADLEERLVIFAAASCRIAQAQHQIAPFRHITAQLTRSATSSAANYTEARSAESRRDFIHKISLCLKELRESYFWLRLLKRLGLADVVLISEAIDEANELISIFVAAVRTAQRNT